MKKLRLLKSLVFDFFQNQKNVQTLLELELTKQWNLWPDRSLNPITSNPKRYFSQSDEDGIIEKLITRLGITKGKIIEFGVGDGKENNSLALIAKGWESYWISGQDLAFNFQDSPKHHFKQEWVTLDNLEEITDIALNKLDSSKDSLDVVSMDFDGNDWHFVKLLLESSLYPKIWICEYNAKLPPGVEWAIPYDETHTWRGDDYFGASFTSFVKLFEKHRYFPVACSVQGANVFFVREVDRGSFLDISLEETQLYQPPLYNLVPQWGHRNSPRTIESIFSINR
jgi:hypothetical protein